MAEEKQNSFNKTVYEWGWCGVCGVPFVKCPGCGNNTCNGGAPCDQCDGAYEHWQKSPWPEGEELRHLQDEEQARYEQWKLDNLDQQLLLELIFGERT